MPIDLSQFDPPADNTMKLEAFDAPTSINVRTSQDDLIDMIIDKANHYGVRPDVALSVAKQESGLNQNAKSPTGVRGLFQVTLKTGRMYKPDYSETDRGNPEISADIGIRYLADLIKEKKGSIREAVSSYNGGSDPDYHYNVGRHLPWARQQIAKRQQQQPAIDLSAFDPPVNLQPTKVETVANPFKGGASSSEPTDLLTRVGTVAKDLYAKLTTPPYQGEVATEPIETFPSAGGIRKIAENFPQPEGVFVPPVQQTVPTYNEEKVIEKDGKKYIQTTKHSMIFNKTLPMLFGGSYTPPSSEVLGRVPAREDKSTMGIAPPKPEVYERHGKLYRFEDLPPAQQAEINRKSGAGMSEFIKGMGEGATLGVYGGGEPVPAGLETWRTAGRYAGILAPFIPALGVAGSVTKAVAPLAAETLGGRVATSGLAGMIVGSQEEVVKQAKEGAQLTGDNLMKIGAAGANSALDLMLLHYGGELVGPWVSNKLRLSEAALGKAGQAIRDFYYRNLPEPLARMYAKGGLPALPPEYASDEAIAEWLKTLPGEERARLIKSNQNIERVAKDLQRTGVKQNELTPNQEEAPSAPTTTTADQVQPEPRQEPPASTTIPVPQPQGPTPGSAPTGSEVAPPEITPQDQNQFITQALGVLADTPGEAKKFTSTIAQAYFRLHPEQAGKVEPNEVLGLITLDDLEVMRQKVPKAAKLIETLEGRIRAKMQEQIQAPVSIQPPTVDMSRPAAGPLFTPEQLQSITHEELLAMPPEQQKIFKQQLKELKAQQIAEGASPKGTLKRVKKQGQPAPPVAITESGAGQSQETPASEQIPSPVPPESVPMSQETAGRDSEPTMAQEPWRRSMDGAGNEASRSATPAETGNTESSSTQTPRGEGAIEASKPEVIVTPKIKKQPTYDLQKAVDQGDIATIVKARGGFDSQSRIIKEATSQEERRQLLPFMRSKQKSPQVVGVDVLLDDLKTDYPHLFGDYETDGDFIRALVDKSYKKKLNRDTIIKDVEWYNDQIIAEAERHGYSPEDAAAAERALEGEVAAEEAVEREYARLERESIAGTEEPGLELSGGKPKPSKHLSRLKDLQDEYPDIDPAKASVVLRAFPAFENPQIAAMSADPEMFNRVAQGNLSATEREQLYKKATDLGKQGNLFGKEPGTLFEEKAPYRAVAPTFYSQMAISLGKKLPGRATSKQYTQLIEGWVKKGDPKAPIKADELKWSGLIPWLQEQEGIVNRQQVLDFLKENQVEVKEVEKGKPKSLGAWEVFDPKDGRAIRGFDTEQEAAAFAKTKGLDYAESGKGYTESPTKFQSYMQLPHGGNNYREVLLTWPLETELQQPGDLYSDTHKILYRPPSSHRYGDPAADANRFAHIFMDDRMIDGKKYLTIWELQSDWAQEGRKEGFKGDYDQYRKDIMESASKNGADLTDVKKALEHIIEEPLDTEARPTGWAWKTLSDATKGEVDLNRVHDIKDQSVPPFPFSKNWMEVALKKVLRQAAEEGYDGIAWATGDMVKDRYDLSKYVDKVSYYPESGNLYCFQEGKVVISQKKVPPEKLADYIGKDVAEKLLKTTPIISIADEKIFVLKGQDLKIGGEWANRQYDQMMPQFLAKYVKQWGAKIGEDDLDTSRRISNLEYKALDNGGYEILDVRTGRTVDFVPDKATAEKYISSQEKSEPIHILSLAPQMRESMLYSGQPLYEPKEIYHEQENAFGSRDKSSENARILAQSIEARVSRKAVPDSVRLWKSTVARNYAERRRVDYRGTQLTSGNEAQDIAALWQVYRSPKAEHLHSIITDRDGVVIAHNALTSGDLSSVNVENLKDFLDSLNHRFDRLSKQGKNPAKIHLVHNHPSGNHKMSGADLLFAKAIKDGYASRNFEVEGLGDRAGEFIVIDHDKFSYFKDGEAIEAPVKSTPKPHEAADNWLIDRGAVSTPSDVADLAKAFLSDRKPLGIFYLNSSNQVNGLMTHGPKLLDKGLGNLETTLRQYARAHDAPASQTVIVTNDPATFAKLQETIQNSAKPVGTWLLDVVGPAGKSLRTIQDWTFEGAEEPKAARGVFEGKKVYPEVVGHEEEIKYLFAGAGPTPKTLELIDKLALDMSDRNMSVLTYYTALPFWVSKRYPVVKPVYKIQTTREMVRHWANEELLGELEEALKWQKLNKKKFKGLSVALHNLVGPLGKVDPTDEQLQEIGFDKSGIKAVRKTWELFDYIADEDLPHFMKLMGAPKNEIDKLRRSMGRIKRFMPHFRQGKYFMHVKQPGGEWTTRSKKDGSPVIYKSETTANSAAIFINKNMAGTDKARAVKTDAGWTLQYKKKAKTEYFELFDDMLATATQTFLRRRLSIKAQIKKAKLLKQYPDAVITAGHKKTMPEEAFWQIDTTNMEAVINAALNAAELPDEVNQGAVEKAIYQAIADTFNKRGFGSHFIRRKGILGYDKTDFLRDAIEFIRAYNGFKTKALAARDFAKAMGQIKPKADPYLWKYIKKYVQDMLTNSDEVDRSIDRLRGGMFLYFLGGVPRQLLLQPTQNFIAGVPALQRYSKWTSAKIVREMALASYDLLHDLGVKGIKAVSGRELPTSKEKRLDKDTQTMLEVLRKRGDIDDQLTQEWMGYLSGTLGRAGQKLSKIASFFIGNAEIYNRETFAVVAYKIARQELKLDHLKALDFTSDLINQVHFKYGKANLPGFTRGDTAAKFARAAYTFRSYPHNLIALYRHLWSDMNPAKAGVKALPGPQLLRMRQQRDGTWKPRRDWRFTTVLKVLGAFLAFGGLTGLPGRKWWEYEIQKQTGSHLRTEVAKATSDFKRLGWLINYGLPGVAGISLASSIGLDPPSWDDIPSTIIGPAYGIAQRGYYAAADLRRGDYLRAAERALPMGAGYPLSAYRLYKYGLTNSHGKAILDQEGQPIKLGGYATFWQSMSVKPIELAESNRRYEAQAIRQEYLQHRQDLLDKYRNVYNRDGNEDAVRDEMDHFEDEVERKNIPGIPSITGGTLRRVRNNKETKSQKEVRETYP